MRRGNDDGVAGMDTDRVDVFHVTYDDGVIIRIPHHLIFYFLEAGYGLFDQALADRRIFQSICNDFPEVIFVVAYAAACAAHRECRTDDERIAHLPCKVISLLYRVDNIRFRHRDLHLIHEWPELALRLRLFDGIKFPPEQFHNVLFQNAQPVEFKRHVQGYLTAERRQEGIRLFLADDPG